MRILVLMLLFTSDLAFAQDQVGAPSSTDSQMFDKALDDAFGKAVSMEARKLKDATPEQRQQMGKAVSAQRRKNLEHKKENRPHSEGSAASAVRNSGRNTDNPGSNRGGNRGNSGRKP